MPTEVRNLPIELTETQLNNAIKNEEAVGYLLRGLTTTTGDTHNLLLVEEGTPPVELSSVKLLDVAAGADPAAVAQAFLNTLAAGGGIVAWGRMKIAGAFRYVAAYRNRGMSVEVAPAAGLREAIVERAVSEWEWFGGQEDDVRGQRIRVGTRENSDVGSERVARYWAEGAGIPGRTGKDTDYYWSAAFVSYVMVKGGADAFFKQSEAHQVYIYEAMMAARNGRADYGYWGRELTDHAPHVGDLICAWRENPVDFARAQNPGFYPAHCDLVVAKTGTTVTVIGGNVGNSVTKRTFKLDQGIVTDAKFPNAFAILENRMPATAPASASAAAGPVVTAGAANFQTCSLDWEVTGYFTPVETDYGGDAEEVRVNGVGHELFARDFLKATRMEGWGRTRLGWYLGYYSGEYHRAAFAKDRFGRELRIGSIAVDQDEIPFGRKLTIPHLPGDWGRTVFTAVDVGQRINNKHIDVFCGEGKEAERISKQLTLNRATAEHPRMASVCFA